MPTITMRRATAADVPTLVALLLDDPLGATRESAGDLRPYYEGFERVQGSPNTHLMVAVLDGEVVGTLTLTVLPGLSRQGASRANIEAVRVVSALRSQGIGSQMMEWAMEVARLLNCRRVQLTSDTSRRDAHRFYEHLGFTGSHIGFTKVL